MINKINSDTIGNIIEQITKHFPDGKEFELGWPILKMTDFKSIGMKSKDVKRKLKSAITRKNREFKKQFKKGEFDTIHISELYKKKFDNPEWIVEKLVPSNGITALSGEPGSYKSYLSLYIAQCVSNGSMVFDRFKTSKTNVLIIDEEEHPSILQKRAKQMKINRESGIFFRPLKGFKINNGEQLDALLRFITKKKIKLVIFDSFRRILTGNENDSEIVNEAHTAYKKIVAIGASVITLHHHRKGQQGQGEDNDPIRGSTDILAGVDCHLQIKVKKPLLTITQKKLRVAEVINPFSIEVVGDEDNIEFKFISDSVIDKKSDLAESLIISLLEDSEQKYITRKEVVSVLKKNNIGTSSVDRAIEELKFKSKIRLETGQRNSKTLYLTEE